MLSRFRAHCFRLVHAILYSYIHFPGSQKSSAEQDHGVLDVECLIQLKQRRVDEALING